MKFELYSPMALHELGQRDNQEDSIFPRLGNINANDRLFLVCDGMGGHEKGEVASAAVANAVSKWIDDNISSDGVLDDETIEEAIRFARKQLDRFDDSSLKKMGTTLTMVSFHNGGVTMGHIGDSRIYHIRPSQRRILYKTIDHSLVYDLFMAGDITYEEMATSSRRNVITRALMPGEENEVNIDLTHTTDVKPGDYFYLCSDGMLEQMSDNELVNLISGDDSDQAKIEKLKKATANNKDNHSAILLKVKGVSSEEGDQQMPNDEKVSHYNEVALLAKMAANAANAAQAPSMPQAPASAMPSAPAMAGASAVSQAAPSMPQQQPVSNMAPNYGEARERPIRRRAMDEDPYEMQPDTGGGSNWLKLLLISMLAIAVIAGAVYIFMDKMGKKGTKEKAETPTETPSTQQQQEAGNTESVVYDYDGGGATHNGGNAGASRQGSSNNAVHPQGGNNSNNAAQQVRGRMEYGKYNKPTQNPPKQTVTPGSGNRDNINTNKPESQGTSQQSRSSSPPSPGSLMKDKKTQQ